MTLKKKGFTLIELSLSIAFIAVLLIGIASIVMHMTSIYQKGLSIKAINATGQQIIEDLQRSINSADYDLRSFLGDSVVGRSLTESDYNGAMSHYFYEKTDSDGKQIVGMLCIGSHAYLWNTAEAIKNDEVSISINGSKPRLARFRDVEHRQCDKDYSGSIANQYDNDTEKSFTVTDPIDLIQKDEVDIALYDFRISPAIQSDYTKQLFVSGAFILATIRGGVNIKANSDFCRGTDTVSEDEFSKYDFDYCAVNKFNFSIRTGGKAS